MLRFEKIDFEKHMDACLKFREDSFRVSFPDSDNWNEQWNPEKYRLWIQDFAKRFPDGAIHLWNNSDLIGQLEFSCKGESGHVNLYYIIPSERGKGYGYMAHKYIVETLKRHGCKQASLRVSPTNKRATKFYNSIGWQDLGADPIQPQVHIRELEL